MEHQITRRSRKIGWDWSTMPTGRGAEIETPDTPHYTGTVRQVLAAISQDTILKSQQGIYKSTAWFLGDKRISQIDRRTDREGMLELMRDLNDGWINSLTVITEA